jgi:hypothetical protein
VLFTSRVSQGNFLDASPKAFEDGDAARQEALAICSDMARDIVRGLSPNSEWRLDVRDDTGVALYSIRFVSEASSLA